MITLTLNTLDPSVGDDGDMAKKPRTDRPRRRSFSPAEKLRLLAGYETATETGTGNAFLRENGLYSSLISEWRRTRDAGLLKGNQAQFMIDVDGVRWGTAAEIAAQLGHGVTEAAVRSWARRNGLPSARFADEHGRPRVQYPLPEAATIDAEKRHGNRGRRRAA